MAGRAIAPAGAPTQVKAAIAAANRIHHKPYVWGGGHLRWWTRGYDCSGAVGYALRGGGLLDQTMVSGQLESWGAGGTGRWITVYANYHHVYMVIAGLRFDTRGDPPGVRDRAGLRAARLAHVRGPPSHRAFSPPMALTERVRRWQEAGETVRFRDRDIHLLTRDGEGPLLLLLHGFPSSSYDWRLMLEAESEDRALLAFDFLGFGLSEKPRDHDYSLSWQADLVEELVRRHGGGGRSSSSPTTWAPRSRPS